MDYVFRVKLILRMDYVIVFIVYKYVCVCKTC